MTRHTTRSAVWTGFGADQVRSPAGELLMNFLRSAGELGATESLPDCVSSCADPPVVESDSCFIDGFCYADGEAAPYAVLLFGGRVEPRPVQGSIVVDGWVSFAAPARVGALVAALREHFDARVVDKAERPQRDVLHAAR